jgi:uncharacterized protein (TIGR02147 family)
MDKSAPHKGLYVKTVFDYLDYRDFMRDHYCLCKESQSFISFRYIEQKTGIDASYYAKVINGKKHIAAGAIPALVTFFKFKKKETDYFTNLVNFCKAKQKEQCDYYFNKLICLRDPSVKKLEVKKYHYFQQWYSVVIRELLDTISYTGDYHELASRIEPSITAHQAQQSIKLLEELKLIEKNTEGYYRTTDKFLTTDSRLRSLAVRDFQKEMIRLAGEAIERFGVEERDISSLTISSSKVCLELIREKLERTRKEILQLVAEHGDTSEEVYQLNIQVFPVSKNRKVDKKKDTAPK